MAVRLLPQRAERDAEQTGDRRDDRASGETVGEMSAGRQLRRHHQRDTGEADGEAGPMAQSDFLPQQRAGEQRRQHRLQTDDDGDEARRHAAAQRPQHAADVGGMDQRAGNRRIARGAWGHPRHEQHDRRQDSQHQREPQRQHRERLGVRARHLRADEPGRPQQHEQDRGEAQQHG